MGRETWYGAHHTNVDRSSILPGVERRTTGMMLIQSTIQSDSGTDPFDRVQKGVKEVT
jgi:hypothetical protein